MGAAARPVQDRAVTARTCDSPRGVAPRRGFLRALLGACGCFALLFAAAAGRAGPGRRRARARRAGARRRAGREPARDQDAPAALRAIRAVRPVERDRRAVRAATRRSPSTARSARARPLTGPEEIAAFLRTRYGGGHEGLEPGDTRLMMIDAPVVTLAPNGREATGRWSVLIFLGGSGKAAIEGGIFVNDYRIDRRQVAHRRGALLPAVLGPLRDRLDQLGRRRPADRALSLHARRCRRAGHGARGRGAGDRATLGRAFGAHPARSTTRTPSATCRPRSATTSTARCGTTWSTCSPRTARSSRRHDLPRQGRGAPLARARWARRASRTASSTTARSSTSRSRSSPGGDEAWARGIELGMLGEADQEKGWWEGAAFLNRFVKEGGVWKLARVCAAFRCSAPTTTSAGAQDRRGAPGGARRCRLPRRRIR